MNGAGMAVGALARAARDTPEHGVSLPRLYLLRLLYLVIVVGLGIEVWPGVVSRPASWAPMEGVVQCMLAAFSLLSLLGLRYPLAMLPVLLWELAWKGLWLGIVAWPLWAAGDLQGAHASIAGACLVAVLFPLAMPWKYLVRRYVRQAGERWC